MIKFLKKIFITSALLIISTCANFALPQGVVEFNSSNYNTWIKACEPACGKGSFYLYAHKTYNQSNGLYYFQVYVWSDSFYKNCNQAYTYIDNVSIYLSENKKNSLNFDYFLASPKTASFNGWNYIAYIYSTSANQKFKFEWGSASPY
jgi:hypothetical protein